MYEYMQHIIACNDYNDKDKIPFLIDGIRVGQVKKEFLEFLLESNFFKFEDNILTFKEEIKGFNKRTKALNTVAKLALKEGFTNRFMNEKYPVIETPNSKPFCFADRSISSMLGLISFGQHLNGYINDNGKIKMWIAKRSLNKGCCPGELDHIVAGGTPYNISLEDNLYKEAYEEASIPKEIVKNAKSVGFVSYKKEYSTGGKLDIIYCYDLELPKDFVPVNSDGEVEEFYLMDIEEVDEIIKRGFEFKYNCALVIIDFFIRHGIIKETHREYFNLVNGLRTLF